MTNARITLTFLVEDFEEFADEWTEEGITTQDAANEALLSLLVEEGPYDLIGMGIEPLNWTIEYPAQEAAQ